jgi:hypothetical protein
MTDPAQGEAVGRWRIIGSALWDRDFLDLVEAAHLSLYAAGHGELVFGAAQVTLTVEFGRSIVFFRWTGFDEGDEIWGDGAAELQDDGSLEIAFNRADGDEAVLIAIRESFSAAC